MASVKKRLDTLLFEEGLAESRKKAQALIMSGVVYVDGDRQDKPGAYFKVEKKPRIEIRGQSLQYVSRGGLKLEKAITVFGIDLKGCIALDVGASTGGFTDCMLQNGAKEVYAVDVGYGMLHYRLRNDDRVHLIEKTNIRYIEPWMIGNAKPDFAGVDVSFISLRLVLAPVKRLLKSDATLVLLIKPQFEAGRDEVGKHGVVKDPKVHKKVALDVIGMVSDLGFSVLGFTYSPIKGPKGNIEYLLYVSNHMGNEYKIGVDETLIENIVAESHSVLE